MQQRFLAGCALLFLLACGNAEQPKVAAPHYFDLKAYFRQEATRLNQSNPLVLKTVSVNDSVENKTLRIEDWSMELANFSDAYINKSAWQGMFKVIKSDSQEVYSSSDDKVMVKKLEVTKKDKGIAAIRIWLNTSNYLYNSTDTLIYIPDSLYEIRKTQQIRFLEVKKYQVKGVL